MYLDTVEAGLLHAHGTRNDELLLLVNLLNREPSCRAPFRLGNGEVLGLDRGRAEGSSLAKYSRRRPTMMKLTYDIAVMAMHSLRKLG